MDDRRKGLGNLLAAGAGMPSSLHCPLLNAPLSTTGMSRGIAQEIDAARAEGLSISIDTDGNATTRSVGDTPLSMTPRTIAAQRRAEEAAAVAELARHVSLLISTSNHSAGARERDCWRVSFRIHG